MNEIILDAIYVLIGLVIAIVAFIGSLNFLMKGMPMAYLKTRISNGKKLLIRVNSAIDKYYTTGYITQGNVLNFKLRGEKENCCINNITEEHYYFSMGVHCIDVNEEPLYALSKRQEVPVSLPDPKIFDSLLKRAMMAPSENTKQFIILLICMVVIFLVACGAMYYSYKAVALIEALKFLSGNV